MRFATELEHASHEIQLGGEIDGAAFAPAQELSRPGNDEGCQRSKPWRPARGGGILLPRRGGRSDDQ